MLVCCVQASTVTVGAVASMQFRAGHGLGDGAGRLVVDLWLPMCPTVLDPKLLPVVGENHACV